MFTQVRDLALSVCFFCTAIAAAYFAIPGRPGSFQAKEGAKDLGDVRQGQSYQVSFEVANNYHEAVTITGVTESCACSDVRISKKYVAPGESIEVLAIWRTGNGRAKANVGVYLDYQTESGEQSHTELRITGNVLPDIEVQPNPIEVHTGGSGEVVVQFVPGELKRFDLLKAKCSHPAFFC